MGGQAVEQEGFGSGQADREEWRDLICPGRGDLASADCSQGDEPLAVGLGVVYAVAFALARNVMAVWPLLTPLDSLFNNLETGGIHFPWASIAGFADIAVAMAVVVWLAMRRQRRQRLSAPPAVPAPEQRTPASA